jgi:Zn ribbon nucleic-acid-binding protein
MKGDNNFINGDTCPICNTGEITIYADDDGSAYTVVCDTCDFFKRCYNKDIEEDDWNDDWNGGGSTIGY